MTPTQARKHNLEVQRCLDAIWTSDTNDLPTIVGNRLTCDEKAEALAILEQFRLAERACAERYGPDAAIASAAASRVIADVDLADHRDMRVFYLIAFGSIAQNGLKNAALHLLALAELALLGLVSFDLATSFALTPYASKEFMRRYGDYKGPSRSRGRPRNLDSYMRELNVRMHCWRQWEAGVAPKAFVSEAAERFGCAASKVKAMMPRITRSARVC